MGVVLSLDIEEALPAILLQASLAGGALKLSQGEWSDPGRAGGYTPTITTKNLPREFFGGRCLLS